MKPKFCSTVKFGVLAIAVTLVAGCENPYVGQLKSDFGWSEAKMLRDGWLKSHPIAQPQVYCYSTLGDADCFTKPKREHLDRQINSSYEGDF